MDWPVLIIALIPVAVWILSTIFRGAEELRDKERSQPTGASPQVPKRPTTELDRFLEEARRRRDTAPKQAKPTIAPPLQEALPVARPSEPPPPVRREEKIDRPAKRPASERKPPSAPVQPPPRVVEMPVVQSESAPVSSQPAPSPTPPTRPHRPSLLLNRLSTMLRDRDSLATAFLLREIFDRPISQRR